MRNTFTSLLNRAGAMKGRLRLGVAGVLCAIMVAALVAPILTPRTQGSVAPERKLVIEDNARCSAMYGCVSQRVSCESSCKLIFAGVIVIPLGECCYVGAEGSSCMYCD